MSEATDTKGKLSSEKRSNAISSASKLLIAFYDVMKIIHNEIYQDNYCMKERYESFKRASSIYTNNVHIDNQEGVMVVPGQDVDRFMIKIGEGCSIQRAEFENPLKERLTRYVPGHLWSNFKVAMDHKLENEVIRECSRKGKEAERSCRKEFMDYALYIYHNIKMETELSTNSPENHGADVPVLYLSSQADGKLAMIMGGKTLAEVDDVKALQSSYDSRSIPAALQIVNTNVDGSGLTSAVLHCKAVYPSPSNDYNKCKAIAKGNDAPNYSVKVKQECEIGRSNDHSLVCAIGSFTDQGADESSEMDSGLYDSDNVPEISSVDHDEEIPEGNKDFAYKSKDIESFIDDSPSSTPEGNKDFAYKPKDIENFIDDSPPSTHEDKDVVNTYVYEELDHVPTIKEMMMNYINGIDAWV